MLCPAQLSFKKQKLLQHIFLFCVQHNFHSHCDRDRGWSFLTEGSLAALMGLAAGVTLLAVQHFQPNRVSWIKDLTTFDSSVFLVYLLPPIIFNCGLGMEKKLFFSNLGTIVCMGVLGTIIAFVIISLFLYAFAEFHVLRIQDCLALGAIFSATDSVATLQVLARESLATRNPGRMPAVCRNHAAFSVVHPTRS